jgi:general secretion pathway protein J
MPGFSRAEPRRRGGREGGFTLLEILVAIVVLGFLLAGLSQGVRFGIQAWGMQTRRIAQQADMDTTLRTLRRLIAEADPGDANETTTLKGGPHTMAWRSRLPLAAELAGGPNADLALGVDGRKRLVLRAEPHPHAQRLGPPPPPLETVLAEGVDHIDLAYFRAGGKNSGWQSSWLDDDMPALVRLRVVFAKNSARHWPDMVAAPRIDRTDQ